MKTPLAIVLADECMQMFDAFKADNYLAFEFAGNNSTGFEMIIQRIGGISVAKKSTMLENKILELKKRIDELEAQLAASLNERRE